MTRKPKPKKRKSRKLTPQEKEQRSQIREITTILKNIGFSKIPHIDGKEIVYDGRTTEMDDIFINENVILVTEYTIGSPGKHLLAKDVFYKKVLSNPRAFISFLLHDEKLKLPSNRPAKQPIDITYSYDISGKIHCLFTDVDSGNKHEIELKPHSTKELDKQIKEVEEITIE